MENTIKYKLFWTFLVTALCAQFYTNMAFAGPAKRVSFAEDDSQCRILPSLMGAKFLVQKIEKKSNQVVGQETVILWRYLNQVAYEFPARGLTEVWNRVSNGQIRPVRHFDNYQRGIEYQPMEVNQGIGSKDWSGKFQIITDDQLKEMTIKEEKNIDCDKQITYMLESEKTLVIWNEKLRLPQKYEVETDGFQFRWTLEEIVSDKTMVVKVFKLRSDYQLTDYADIGDNESDPFLLKMVNLGFLSHQSAMLGSVPHQNVANSSGRQSLRKH
ncbi:hypothetical protein [Aliikangiella sp. G2MR2-5]|uniref:hypothetical protein n=1 Tax=Aliikangiella sp. G2MR2-5 TaxID=2788943 RepID=UPI0018A990A6|nr:hypothetical protein [Aliikangiella sp. G2MR2-5]